MIKVLIVCKDNLTAKLLVNNVTGKIHDLHLIGIANTITEGFIVNFMQRNYVGYMDLL